MHFPDRRPDQTEERILPLINVVFLLLIFFMIAGSLAVTEPFAVDPPESRSEAATEPELLILMGGDARLALDNEPVSEEALLNAMRAVLEEDPDIRVTLKADAGLEANHLVRFTQALHDVGVSKLHLMTLPLAQ
jgi:biopolymer transport protein ExbD